MFIRACRRVGKFLHELGDKVEKVIHHESFGPLTGCLFVPMYCLLSVGAPPWVCLVLVAGIFTYVAYRALGSHTTIEKGN